MKRLIYLACGVLFLSCAAARAATPGGMVFVADPTPVNPAVGDTFAVEVRGKDFPNSIDGGGLNITFDSGVLQLVDITPAEPWKDFFSPGIRSNALGTVEGLYFNSLAQDGVGGEFDIVKLTFAAISDGVARIRLAGDDLLVFGRLEEQFMPQFAGREVSVLAVPEPVTWLALCVGTVLMIGLRIWGAPDRPDNNSRELQRV